MRNYNFFGWVRNQRLIPKTLKNKMQHTFNFDVQFSCDGFVVVSNYINIETVYSKIFEKKRPFHSKSANVRSSEMLKNKQNAD